MKFIQFFMRDEVDGSPELTANNEKRLYVDDPEGSADQHLREFPTLRMYFGNTSPGSTSVQVTIAPRKPTTTNPSHGIIGTYIGTYPRAEAIALAVAHVRMGQT